ncbi:hypothetical protein EDD15DRAFT_2277118 [Pisolithus albus]|nr:hypothetical protein EDD15DRAFT_2277118 [Pisolithus albus]
MRDPSKLVAIGRAGPASSRSQIQVYSPGGKGILLFKWDQGRIVRFGFTHDERPAVIKESTDSTTHKVNTENCLLGRKLRRRASLMLASTKTGSWPSLDPSHFWR